MTDGIDLVGHPSLKAFAETMDNEVDKSSNSFLRLRCEQKKARFVDKDLVDLVGHQSLGDKAETLFCEVYKP